MGIIINIIWHISCDFQGLLLKIDSFHNIQMGTVYRYDTQQPLCTVGFSVLVVASFSSV